jgi:uncharacterized protein
VKIVFDANVLVSGLTRRTSGPPTLLVDMWQQGMFDLFLSQHILTKVGDAWRKPYYRVTLSLSEQEVLDILRDVAALAIIVIPVNGVHGVAEDDEDDLVLATAIAAEADYLVSGDKYLQRIGEFRGIPIVSPREFLDLMLDLPPGT